MLKGCKQLEQPEADRKHWHVVVMPLLENNTKEEGRRVSLGDSVAGPDLLMGQMYALLQERCSEGWPFRMKHGKGELLPDTEPELYSF